MSARNLVWKKICAPGGRLLATYDSSTQPSPGYHYNLTDWLGTKRMQTTAGGNSQETCISNPYGDGLTCTGGADATEAHFTGKDHDTESGLDYFYARYYSETLGRFMTPDWAAAPAAVPYAAYGDPQSLNLYSYVQNNPLTGIDVDGHVGFAPICNAECENSEYNDYLDRLPSDPETDAEGYTLPQQDGDDDTQNPDGSLNQDPTITAQQQQSDEIAGQINHETMGMKDSKTENESLASAENKIAHVRLNGIKKWGSNEKAQKYASLVSAIEKGPGFKLSQQAVEQAIREDSKGIDPTSGAIYYNMRTESQFKHGGTFQGQTVHTASGPYISPSKYTYIMTYGPPLN